MTSDVNCPRLFIYIPTYNRPKSLRRQLTALTAQRNDWPGDMRILVNDNASPMLSKDDLASISSEFGVDVRRNPANLGGNANIALGFVFVQDDEYLWILSDNDTLGPQALHFIAAEGLCKDSDAIVFNTEADTPSDFVHQWSSAWDGVREAGLISNVIYRSTVFLPQATQAFFYHNTSFPHLCVMLSTLKERGSLRYRVLPRKNAFAPESPHGEHPGDYSMSLSGMPQLLPLLPAPEARRFARGWLRKHGVGFFEHRKSYPGIHVTTRAYLRSFGGFRARVLLIGVPIRGMLWCGIGRPIRSLLLPLIPERLKKSLRSLLR